MELAEKLLAWYDKEKRTDLPWRNDPSPYHVWISEIMLQQTRVETVRSYYLRFLEALPDIRSLANVEDEKLLKLWQGLGYYSRAKNLKKAAQIIVEEFNGKLPSEKKELEKLPGIGPYTAGAISSIAFQKREIAADGNAYRVGARLTKEKGYLNQTKTRRRLESFLADHIPKDRPGDFNQALMDLGSAICLPNGQPKCQDCPIQEFCQAYAFSDPLLYPRKKEKKPRKIEKKTVFVIQKEGRTLIVRRPDSGLLAGLWALPMIEGFISSKQVIEKAEGVLDEKIPAHSKVISLGKAKHIFSHIEWHMKGWKILIEGDSIRFSDRQENYHYEKDIIGKWASPEELMETYSIPTAFRAYLPLKKRN